MCRIIPILLVASISSLICSGGEQERIQFLQSSDPDPTREEKDRSLDEITVREVNEFHSALLDRCILNVRGEVDLILSYEGIVSIDDGDRRVRDESGKTLPLRIGQRIVGDIGSPLEWSLFGDDPSALFSVWLSIRRTKETVTDWSSGKRKLYVNLSFMHGRWKSRDERRPELADHSIAEFLSLLKEKNPAVEE